MRSPLSCSVFPALSAKLAIHDVLQSLFQFPAPDSALGLERNQRAEMSGLVDRCEATDAPQDFSNRSDLHPFNSSVRASRWACRSGIAWRKRSTFRVPCKTVV